MTPLAHFKESFATELGKYAAKAVYVVVLIILGFAFHAIGR